jgi:hypothetical protein
VNRIASEAHNEYAEVAVRGHPEAGPERKELLCPTQL